MSVMAKAVSLNHLTSIQLNGIVNGIVRSNGSSDQILTVHCPSSCERFHSSVLSINEATELDQTMKCSCICPPTHPTYITTTKKCVNQLEDCQETIRWRNMESVIPVVTLHPHTVILPESSLDFQSVTFGTSKNCSIDRIMYENVHTKWKSLMNGNQLFQLLVIGGRPTLYFGGTIVDASFLTGSVVFLTLVCSEYYSADPSHTLCISFRIAGTSASRPEFSTSTYIKDTGNSVSQFGDDDDEPLWKVETTFGLLVILGVMISIIVSFLFWNICWSIKKRKLISDFQTHFAQQYRQNDIQTQIISMESNDRSNEEEDLDERASSEKSVNRKRLVFSTEYFEEQQLIHPSPFAIQFLYDLRRVIDIAKDRIRQRRFLPSLPPILETAEKEEDETVNYSTAEPSNETRIATNSAHSSPSTDQKSVDSGRESREASDDEEEKLKHETAVKITVAEIVKEFEKSAPRPSYVPIMLNSSMRKENYRNPRSHLKTATPTPEKSMKEVFENRVRVPTLKLSGNLSSQSRLSAHAVFPSDGTFNKSLPRRLKRRSHLND